MKTNRLIALGMALVAISYGLGRYTYGLFVPEFRETLGIGTAAIGTIASISHLGYIVAILLCMHLIQRFSPRTIILFGGLSAAAGLLVMAVAQSAIVLAAAVFFASMSAGWIWTATPDAVRQLQPSQQHNRVLAWTNSGTGLGVLAATPVALLLIVWREAFVAYSLLALAVTVWAWVALPSMQVGGSNRKIHLDLRWFVCPRSGPLLMMALAIGLVGAIYWTFAVDLIVSAGLSAPWIKQAFWFVSGAAGIFGVVVAGVIRRYGIRRVIPVNMIVLALALGLPALAPTSLIAVMASAAAFGVGFITITGLLSIWSVRVFVERPAAGLGAVLILIAAGQVVGPIIAGVVAESVGLIPIFVAGVVIALVSMVLRPRRSDDVQTTQQEAHSTTRYDSVDTPYAA